MNPKMGQKSLFHTIFGTPIWTHLIQCEHKQRHLDTPYPQGRPLDLDPLNRNTPKLDSKW